MGYAEAAGRNAKGVRMRSVPLTTLHGGINRLRSRGGARADSLYDLVNAYLDDDGNAVPRPGTKRVAQLPAGTVGLCAWRDKLLVFATTPLDLSGQPLFELVVLKYPQPEGEEPADVALKEIHFAEPFLGALYVVAEFDDGEVYHYWLEEGSTWEPGTEYSANQIARPTSFAGFVFRARRFGEPYPSWIPGAPRELGDRVEPTEYNEFFYEVTSAVGDSPASGPVEPHWPTRTGQTVVEHRGVVDEANDPTPPTPPQPNQPSQDIIDRYRRVIRP